MIPHFSKSLPFSLSLLLALLFLTSCADKPTETPTPTQNKDQARLVGRIASINNHQKFVLIQSYGSWKIPTGAILATIGPDGRAANLKVTGEKSGQFAAADIQSGHLEIGDSVYTTLTREAIDTVDEEDEEETQEPETQDTSEASPNSSL